VLDEPDDAWLLTLQDQWERCQAKPGPTQPSMPATLVLLVGVNAGCVPGCSGSPIVIASGEAVGVISVGHDPLWPNEVNCEPMLAMHLPAWFLADMRRAASCAPEEWLPAGRSAPLDED
jgi:hypothetical protein